VKCSKFLTELNDFLDGSLDTTLKAELQEHLTWCHNCYVVCNTTKKTIEIYRENQVYELPDALRTKLHDAIVAKCKNSKPPSEA
jgi:hypothetical protein